MAEEIKAFKPCCCNKAYMHKSSAVQHEKKCFKNPVNKACVTCGNCTKETDTVYIPPQLDQNYGDADYDEIYYWCDGYGKKLVSKYDKETDR